MADAQVNINQSVAILCDGNNIERSIHDASGAQNSMVNFDTLIPKLLNRRSLNRFFYFREGLNISSKLAERLHHNYYGSVIPCHKTADIPLTIKAMQLSSKVDTIIILSGDSDYVELVRHLKSEGVRVEIAAVKQNTARILLDEADYYHPITKEDWFVYKQKPRHGGRREHGRGPRPAEQQNTEPGAAPAAPAQALPPAPAPSAPGPAPAPVAAVEKRPAPLPAVRPLAEAPKPAQLPPVRPVGEAAENKPAPKKKTVARRPKATRKKATPKK